jgi:CDP-diacylglycerol--serine O-phosphatidyltransferase
MVAGVFLLAFLMVSTIRYFSLKHLALGKKSHLTILLIAMLVALIFFYSKETLLAIAVAYILSGPIVRIYGSVRRRKAGEGMPLADSPHHR